MMLAKTFPHDQDVMEANLQDYVKDMLQASDQRQDKDVVVIQDGQQEDHRSLLIVHSPRHNDSLEMCLERSLKKEHQHHTSLCPCGSMGDISSSNSSSSSSSSKEETATGQQQQPDSCWATETTPLMPG
jgi:hypothetical protein